MEQQSLPGFPTNTGKAVKLRQRRDAKGIDAVLALARCLEKLLSPEAGAGDPGELTNTLKRKRGRPKIQRSVPEVIAADQVKPNLEKPVDKVDLAKLIVVSPPSWKNMDAIFNSFQDACLTPDPHAVTKAADIYSEFCGWFLNEFPGRLEPSPHLLGKQLGRRFFREKKGTYRYHGIRINGR